MMLVAELQELEEVKNLLTKGQQLGVIAYGEVATALAEVEVDEGDIEELYGYLESSGVELVEDVDPAQQRVAEAASAPTASAAPQAAGARPEAGHDDRLACSCSSRTSARSAC